MADVLSANIKQDDHFKPFLGVEELGHLEMIGTLVYQLTRNLSIDEIKKAGFDAYFVDHTTGVSLKCGRCTLYCGLSAE